MDSSESHLIKVPKTFGCTMRSAQAADGLAPLVRLAQATTARGASLAASARAPVAVEDNGPRYLVHCDFVTKDKSPTLEAPE